MNSLKEVIVVEGRDDTAAIKRALDTDTIETHGFGIRQETWELIEKAYRSRGIVIFTDPDFSGEEIRRRLTERFPNARQAYLAQEDAIKDHDIGIENASPEAILDALAKTHVCHRKKREEFIMQDLIETGLCGQKESKEKRAQMGKVLGIGYGSSKRFLEKLNRYDIDREEFLKHV